MSVTDVGRNTSRTLFDGTETDRLPLVSSEYSVDKTHDIVISFANTVGETKGSISIRARILGATPTEIPVENYTVVNDKELKEERKLLFADNTEFFRDDAHGLLIEHLSLLQRTNADYHAFLLSTAGAGVTSLYGRDSGLAWQNGQELPESLRSGVSKGGTHSAVANISRSFGADANTRLKALQDALVQVQDDVNRLFLNSRLSTQLENGDLGTVRRLALGVVADLASWRSQLDLSLESERKNLDACAAQTAAYVASKPIAASDRAGTKVTIPSTTYMRLDGDTVVFPPDLAGYKINLKAELAKLEDRTREGDCYDLILPAVINQLGSLLRTADDIRVTVREDKDHSRGVLLRIETMKEVIQKGIQKRLLSAVRDGRVRMSQLDLKHGDRIEIIIRINRQGTAIRDNEERGTFDIEERVVIRAVENHVSFSTSPQFALIKRASDVRVANASEVPSNFKPAPGVTFSVRYRNLSRIGDWTFPSLGWSAHVVDFDPSNPLELGTGPSIGILDEHFHGGMGWNLSVEEHRRYYWISLDFLRTYDTFSGLFGGDK